MPETSNSGGRRTTILAVDDDAGILRLMETVLRKAGYNVLAADGGWSAVRAFENSPEPVQLLLTDVIMPDLTGPVLAARLIRRQPSLRVLFISGFHDAGLVHHVMARSPHKLLAKPFTPEALLREVGDTLGAA